MRNNLYTEGMVVGIILLFLGASIASSLSINLPTNSQPMTRGWYYVGGYGPGNYTTIQSAIDASSNGDTIFVYNGIYTENININKQLTILSQNGASSTIIQAANIANNVISISSNVAIKGFTIRNSNTRGIYLTYSAFSGENLNITNNGQYAIYLYSGNTAFTLKNTTIQNNGAGIYQSTSYTSNGNALIEHTTIQNNAGAAISIRLAATKTATIRHNIINTNTGDGIQCYISGGGPTTIYNNTITGVGGTGISLQGATPGIITDNTIQGTLSNNYGIYASGSTLYLENLSITDNANNAIYLNIGNTAFTLKNTTIQNNGAGIYQNPSYTSNGNALIEHTTIQNNAGTAISIRLAATKTATIRHNTINTIAGNGIECYLSSGGQAIIENNDVVNCTQRGISLTGTQNGHIENNRLIDNNYGIYLYTCSGNDIYHNNFISNNQQAYDPGNNHWNDTYPSGGNYWDDYTGIDADGDGIGDTPYPIPGGSNQDYYPLMEPFDPENEPPYTPNTPSGPVSLIIGQSASYTTSAIDPNNDKVQYRFDWDSAGSHEYSDWTNLVNSGQTASISHSWNVPGVYVVKAQARDEHGSSSTWSTGLTVTVGGGELIPFNRKGTVAYADTWWDDSNPHYKYYTNADCANYVSQCLIAGGLSLWKGTNGYGGGVYDDSNGTIPYCDYLHLHLKNYQPVAYSYIIYPGTGAPNYLETGDVIIYGNSDDHWTHAAIVTEGKGSNAKINCHTINRYHELWNSFSQNGDYVHFYHFNTRNFTDLDYAQFKVNTDSLNVRVGPSTSNPNYQIIGSIQLNDEYEKFNAYTDSQGNTWYQFWFDDRNAWAAASLVKDTMENLEFKINTDTVRVYSGPSTSNNVLGTIHHGMAFTSYEKSNGWYHFYYGNGDGWCQIQYTQVIRGVPNKPIISGPTEGETGKVYDYIFATTDPAQRNVWYYIEWGDNTNSGWIGPYLSGQQVIKSHSWSQKGTYLIKCKAKNVDNVESEWGTLSVTMPCLYNIPFIIERLIDVWERLLERFPHAFPLLRHLTGY